MTGNPSTTAQLFLEGLNASSTKDAIDNLVKLVEQLETKEDPDMVEVRLVENIYSFIEKLRIMEGNLRSYVKEKRGDPPGNKLASLYENNSYNGGGGYLRD